MKKSYYAIIPAKVRYDKDLSPNAKLMYGELTALSNDKGYCYATNNYFAELYSVTKGTVSKWVSLLHKKKYITVELKRNIFNKEIESRHIRICIDDNHHTYNAKEVYPMAQKNHTPMAIKDQENTTNIILQTNIEKVSKKNFRKPTIKDLQEYCRDRNNSVDYTKLWDFYESKDWMIGKNKMKDWKACVRTWERSSAGKEKAPHKSAMETLMDKHNIK